jgi:hypothetical protein
MDLDQLEEMEEVGNYQELTPYHQDMSMANCWQRWQKEKVRLMEKAQERIVMMNKKDQMIIKLARIRHEITGTSQSIQVILNGRYQLEQGWEEVSYCRTFREQKVPEDILEPLRITAEAIGVLTLQAGAVALPLPVQTLGIDREALEITVAKRGSGIQILYKRRDQKNIPATNHDLKSRAIFLN